MDDFWFAMYHVYSMKKSFDTKGLKNFEKDVKFAQEIGIRTLVLEDYYKDFIWGEYTNLWDEKTLQTMIKIIHDYGIKFIPYMDTTELATHGKIYYKNGREWGAKNRWGRPYSAFSSIFLADYYPHDWHTKLMCPYSGWKDYFLNQAHVLLTQYDVDGIYLDRLDYRVICYDHSQNPSHFVEGIPTLVKRIRNEVKSACSKNLLIINDSCINPDSILIKCIKYVDFVLTELLPIDTNPRNFYQQFLIEQGDLIWAFHRILKPILKFFTNFSFNRFAMVDPIRIQSIINRLYPYIGQKIILFSHRKDYKSFKFIENITQKNQLYFGYFAGRKYLLTIKNFFK